MVVKAIRQYQTDDGQTFDSLQHANLHAARLKSQTAVRKALQTINPSASISTWDRDIASNMKALTVLRDACNIGLNALRNHTPKTSIKS